MELKNKKIFLETWQKVERHIFHKNTVTENIYIYNPEFLKIDERKFLAIVIRKRAAVNLSFI